MLRDPGAMRSSQGLQRCHQICHLGDLPFRRQEVLHCIQKVAEAYWQALPINILKYGQNFAIGLPGVLKVIQTPEYGAFSNCVRQAEYDSMHMLENVDNVPHLVDGHWNTTPLQALMHTQCCQMQLPLQNPQRSVRDSYTVTLKVQHWRKSRESWLHSRKQETSRQLTFSCSKTKQAGQQNKQKPKQQLLLLNSAEAPLPSSVAMSSMAMPAARGKDSKGSSMSSAEAPQLNAMICKANL